MGRHESSYDDYRVGSSLRGKTGEGEEEEEEDRKLSTPKGSMNRHTPAYYDALATLMYTHIRRL